jgi:geranylgeranyl pyrophosphate synthase
MTRVTSVADTRDLVEVGLKATEDLMLQTVNSEVVVLKEASQHILNAGGKRIRPRMAILAYLAAGGEDVYEVAAPAAAVELMHTASVVHDDINDHGVVRRGRPSVNAKWGRTFALLTGDFLFTAVYQVMAPYGDMNTILANAATALVEGETLQAWAVKNNEFTSENYMRIIALKTAALFQAAAEMGGRMATDDEEVIEGLSQYAYNIGLAFQIIDDILDIVGDEETLGKTAGIDIEQGRGIAAVQEDEDDPMNAIKRKLMGGDRLEKAQMQVQMFVQTAINSLDVLEDSHAKDELIALAQLVANRNH